MATKGSKSREQDSVTPKERMLSEPRPRSFFIVKLKTDSHVLEAARRPISLDERQVNAVSGRIELDLRLGASFTRFQTLTLQKMGGGLSDSIISYGNCM